MTTKKDSLTPATKHIICEQGTEAPNSGRYNLWEKQGTYLCRMCGIALFRSDQKFLGSCGWPSFDDEIEGRIRRLADPDGKRTEIRCQTCDAHLGHVFHGEGLTAKNLRHCVNSASVDFVNDTKVQNSEEAIYAGGCFWGVESLLTEVPGVIYTEVGYSGGHLDNPSYDAVCRGDSGHIEAIRIIFNPDIIDYATLTKAFLEIHDPTQADGQGPDIGSQYASAIFYYNDQQRETATTLLKKLKDKGFNIVTQLRPVSVFWPAEDYHQNYYQKNNQAPYCHTRVKRF